MTVARVSTLFTSVGLAASNVVGGAPVPGPADQPLSGVRAKRPWMYGGYSRGSGASPSITWSRPVSSPKRYSSGPATSVIGTSPTMPASAISTRARSSASISRRNDAFTAMYAALAPTASAAIARPSTTWYGSARMMARSLKVPGSPSAPLATTYRSPAPSSGPAPRIDAHFRPVG